MSVGRRVERVRVDVLDELPMHPEVTEVIHFIVLGRRWHH